MRIDQLKTLKDILWKNSVNINSKDFDQVFNDLQTLRCLLKSFLATYKKVEVDSQFKKSLEFKKDQLSIENEYQQPLKELISISEKLESESDARTRGKAWALLGYLQAFVFGNVGYIDPQQKVALKLRYVEEDILDSDNTDLVANLHSRIFGLTDDSILHPRLAKMKEGTEKLEESKKSLQERKAVRPANSEFTALSRKFSTFRAVVGSYEKVNRHVQRLTETTLELEKEVNIFVSPYNQKVIFADIKYFCIYKKK